ncbi:MAG: TRAP transporter permease, partial [Pirellulaceae bacterium]
FLEISGATRFVIETARRVFARVTGGPALVSVVSSGLLGSLSGSAVANSMLSGNFTIPMMRQGGFNRETAAGIEAAASTGGALVPPVMGAGAYMILDMIDPTVTFLQIMKAAVIPACLYYFSVLVIVYLYALRVGARPVETQETEPQESRTLDGVIFVTSLVLLVFLLLRGLTPFRAVTGSLVAIMLMSVFRDKIGDGVRLTSRSRIFMLVAFVVGVAIYFGWSLLFTDTFDEPLPRSKWFDVGLEASIVGMLAMIIAGLFERNWQPTILDAMRKSARNGVSLIAAAACVGIIIGIVLQTGIADDFSSRIKDVVEQNLLLALIGIMICSIVLGMGVPSVVCYLLVATLMATLLGDMGVIPLGAHLFIFYFGMMSMVTPPVALAAYATSSIAESNMMKTAFTAFRFALVGFTLPYMFIYRPALLLMDGGAWQAWMDAETNSPEKAELLSAANAAWPAWTEIAIAVGAAVAGILALAAGIAGYLRGRLPTPWRVVLFVAAAMLLLPEIYVAGRDVGVWVNLAGAALFALVVFVSPGTNTPEVASVDSM